MRHHCRVDSRLEVLDVPFRPAVKVLYGGMRKFKQVRFCISIAVPAGCGDAGRHVSCRMTPEALHAWRERHCCDQLSIPLAGLCRTARSAGGLLTGFTGLLRTLCAAFSVTMTQGEVCVCSHSWHWTSFTLQPDETSQQLSQDSRPVASFCATTRACRPCLGLARGDSSCYLVALLTQGLCRLFLLRQH